MGTNLDEPGPRRHKPEEKQIAWPPQGAEPLFYSAFTADWGRCRRFPEAARILLRGRDFPQNRPRSSCDDNLHFPRYSSSAYSYAEKQRKRGFRRASGVPQVSGPRRRSFGHPFFLSLENPLPPSTVEAALFIRDSPPAAFVQFWNSQLQAVDALVAASSDVEAKWCELTPPHIAPAAGRVQLDALMSLALQRSLGARFGAINSYYASN